MAEKPKNKTAPKGEDRKLTEESNLAEKLKTEEVSIQRLTTIHARMTEQILRAQGRIELLRELLATSAPETNE